MPAATPDTIPVVDPTVAIAVLLLLHVPPPGLQLKAVVVPGHKLFIPVIPDGKGLTVNNIVAITLPQGNVTA